ncbi:hypothetical protein OCE55_28180 [Bacillus paranthracis]|nr:hypothetical protein [Bacillus paranthracis]
MSSNVSTGTCVMKLASSSGNFRISCAVLSNGSVTYQLIHLYKKSVVSVMLIAF